MKNKNTYFANLVYSIYMGVIMGFIITSIFLVIITNVDMYFFDSYLGIRGDWLYYIGTFILVPLFGAIYIYNQRIIIENNNIILREKPLSFNTSNMDISTIKSISLHKQEGRRKIKKGIKLADGETAIMVMTKPFSDATVSLIIKEIVKINPEINIDDYYKKVLNI